MKLCLSTVMQYNHADVVRDCIDMKADHPELRLCAADEWKDILLDWINEACMRGDFDRWCRLIGLLQVCIHSELP